MTVMTATEFSPAGSGPLTVHDLEGLPDDGRRYELIDGVLMMSPVPGTRHQTIAYRLFGVLERVCPEHLYVVGAPFAIHPGGAVELQPDLLVALEDQLTDKDLPAAPVMAVEVLSPSTAIHDLNTKKAVYERIGTASYWVIDPVEPAVTVFELDEGGRYTQTAKVAGGEPLEVTRPFPVRLVPNDLLGRLAEP